MAKKVKIIDIPNKIGMTTNSLFTRMIRASFDNVYINYPFDYKS